MAHYHIILAEDHVMVRQGIRKIIEAHPEFMVVAEAGNGSELLDLLDKVPVDLVITDISMPSLSGIEAARQIKARHPRVKVLILSMHKRRELLNLAMRAGADGYLLKEDAESELYSALENMRRGGIYVSPLLVNSLEDLLHDAGGLSLGRQRRGFNSLTDREAQVLRLICEGKSTKEIGSLLYLSFRTIQHHRANIKRKLNLKTTSDLMKYALRQGLASP